VRVPESVPVILASGLVERATDVIESIGLVGVGGLIALESVFPPIPSEVVLLLSGFQVSTGKFGFIGAWIAATIGSLVGALILYGVGRLVGEERLEWLLLKLGKPLGFKRSDIDRADAWWDRHGDMVVLFGRMIPLVRSVVSIPAGSNEMKLGKFCLYTTIGSAAWNLIWISVGNALGDQWEKAERWTGFIDYAVYAGIIGLLGWLIIRKQRERRTAAASASSAGSSPD
jgi:membrane protein DedA with SNARE-associated domain